ncbi:hypothetical protein [Paraburkholderia caffeinilytica]|uniref:hypothetical protein n=1 Tax=Paraburkholderia caffeinilytica TaxID=1761016 RepID=UPI003DA02E23
MRDLTAQLSEHVGLRRSIEKKLQHSHEALKPCRTATSELLEHKAHRHEQQVQHLQAKLRQVNQTLVVRQNEITQLNRNKARLVAETGVATRYDALQITARTQATELTQVREARESLGAALTKLTARFDAQQQLLWNYRIVFEDERFHKPEPIPENGEIAVAKSSKKPHP